MGFTQKDKFVKDSVSLNACTKSSYSSYYDTDTELTKKYIPYHIQYKGTPSAIKTWLSKPSCPFEGRTNFVDDIENVMKSATENRLNKIEKFDKIIVFDNGTIKGQGTHDELMKLQKRYYTLHKYSSLG